MTQTAPAHRLKRVAPWLDEAWRQFIATRQRMPHAWLLHGARGIGKLEFALQAAQWLLCEAPDKTSAACGVCPACTWFSQGSHPDFRRIEPETLAENPDIKGDRKPSPYIRIEQIRDLSNFFTLAAARGGARVVLVQPAEAMNVNAANALLKMLEEPPGQVIFLLISHQRGRILPTILSRCRQLLLPTPDRATGTAWLTDRQADQPAELLAQAGGSPMLAATLDDADHQSARRQFLRHLARPDDLDVVAVAESLQNQEPGQVLAWLQQWVYDLQQMSVQTEPRYHIDFTKELVNLAPQTSAQRNVALYRQLLGYQPWVHHPLNARLFLEQLLMNYLDTRH